MYKIILLGMILLTPCGAMADEDAIDIIRAQQAEAEKKAEDALWEATLKAARDEAAKAEMERELKVRTANVAQLLKMRDVTIDTLNNYETQIADHIKRVESGAADANEKPALKDLQTKAAELKAQRDMLSKKIEDETKTTPVKMAKPLSAEALAAAIKDKQLVRLTFRGRISMADIDVAVKKKFPATDDVFCRGKDEAMQSRIMVTMAVTDDSKKRLVEIQKFAESMNLAIDEEGIESLVQIRDTGKRDEAIKLAPKVIDDLSAALKTEIPDATCKAITTTSPELAKIEFSLGPKKAGRLIIAQATIAHLAKLETTAGTHTPIPALGLIVTLWFEPGQGIAQDATADDLKTVQKAVEQALYPFKKRAS